LNGQSQDRTLPKLNEAKPTKVDQKRRSGDHGLRNLPEKALPPSIPGANWSRACSMFRYACLTSSKIAVVAANAHLAACWRQWAVLFSVGRVALASFAASTGVSSPSELCSSVTILTIFALPMDYMSEKFSVRFRDLDLKIPLRVIGGQTDRRSGRVGSLWFGCFGGAYSAASLFFLLAFGDQRPPEDPG
jgi:hypothetical protein